MNYKLIFRFHKAVAEPSMANSTAVI